MKFFKTINELSISIKLIIILKHCFLKTCCSYINIEYFPPHKLVCINWIFSLTHVLKLAVTSILGIITTINEHILETTPTQTRARHVEPSSFPFSLCITILKDLETLVEVAAQQLYGEEKKWNFMAITEAIK